MPPTKITVAVDKPSVPTGMVLIEDAGTLSNGLHDSLARLVQRQLGFPWRAKLRDEAKRLTRVALTGVIEGSGVLLYESLHAPGVTGRPPVAVAARDLVTGISSFSESHRWPPYLPASVRNRLGWAVAPVFSEENSRIFLLVEDEAFTARCEITASVKEALQTPEDFAPDQPVEVVGSVFDLNIRHYSFKVDAAGRIVTVYVDERRFGRIQSDDMRWGRVFVAGLPEDSQCRAMRDITELRLARNDEEDGLNVPNERRRGERTAAYQATLERAQNLLALGDDWNTYHGRSPSKRAMAFALNFLRDATGVLMDHEIDVPTPFLVPTPSGGVQYEWRVGARELELEIPEKGRFVYLATDGKAETEGEASRWTAMRLLRWVISGEEV